MVKAAVRSSSEQDLSAAKEFAPVYLEESARDHVWIHSLPWADLAEKDGFRVFDRGENSTIYDIQGRGYFDAISGLWVVNAGHGRKDIAARMGEQAGRLAYASAMSFTTVPQVQLAEMIARAHPRRPQSRFLLLGRFGSGGIRYQDRQAGADDARLPTALQDHRPPRFLSRHDLWRDEHHQSVRDEASFGPFMYGVYHVPHPDRYRSDFGVEGEQADIMAARAVEQEIIYQGPDTVAAVIGEPISTAAGVHVPSPIYWQMLRETCDKYGVLLICDEVINGFGRTGKMFAQELFGIQGDIMTIAKALSSGYAPIAAAVVSDKVYDIFKEKDQTPMGHLLTFGGHPVACAAAIRNLEIFDEENLVEKGNEMGTYLGQQLETLTSHPSVGQVRGVGMVWGLDLVSNKETREKFAKDSKFKKALGQLLMDRNIVTRVWDVMHFAPPLVVTKAEIDELITKVDEALTVAENTYASEIVA